MEQKPKLLAICGSTKKASLNSSLLRGLALQTEVEWEWTILPGIDNLPHFNPDLDTDTPPPSVIRFRNAIRSADAVLICTPEYAMGVPGTLKNALDWTVSTTVFSDKPTALITASSQGMKGHAALMETLRIIQCAISGETELVLSYIKTKVHPTDGITDAETERKVLFLLKALGLAVQKGRSGIH